MNEVTGKNDDIRTEICVLLDYYGALLSEHQRSALKLYVEDDLSLSEISELLNISRQGAHDLIRRASDRLFLYEEKLGLSGRDRSMYDTLRHAKRALEKGEYGMAADDLAALDRTIGLGPL